VLTFLLIAALIVCVVALIWSLIAIRNQQHKELDKGMNETTIKHPILANPILIANILFPIILALGAILVMYLTR